MVEKGMTPMNAILSCTREVARAYGKEKDYGTVDLGKVADLILVRHDPLADIAHMSDLSTVIKDGVPVDFERLPVTPLVTRYPRGEDSLR